MKGLNYGLMSQESFGKSCDSGRVHGMVPYLPGRATANGGTSSCRAPPCHDQTQRDSDFAPIQFFLNFFLFLSFLFLLFFSFFLSFGRRKPKNQKNRKIVQEFGPFGVQPIHRRAPVGGAPLHRVLRSLVVGET